MQTTIEKQKLLEILQENRANHKAIFDEAVDGYQKRAIEELERHLERIRRGKREKVQVYLPQPEEHTKDYDRIIRMVELHQDATIELSESDVASYIMDDWAWKRQFLASNSSYSVMAATASIAED